jgi:hypothetical protein
MSGPIIRSGPSPKFVQNWDSVFGKGDKAKKAEAKPEAKAEKKTAKAAKPAAKPAKKSAKKKAKK